MYVATSSPAFYIFLSTKPPRFADGMFAILIPVSLAPLIGTLLWAERKARKNGLIRRSDAPRGSLVKKIIATLDQLDVIGLLLIGTSVALILLPLTLSENAKGGWHNGTFSRI